MATSKGFDGAAVARIVERIGNIPKGFDGQVGQVGWFPTAKYETGTPVAYVALIQEKGAPAVGIPPRPFIQPTIDEKKADWTALMAEGMREVVKGTMSPKDVLEGVGLQAAGDIRATLAAANVAPLSPVTVLLRKWKKEGRTINRTVVQEARAAIAAGASIAGIPDTPLHDSGLMQATISNTVGPAPVGA
jgi:hypothetical protein